MSDAAPSTLESKPNAADENGAPLDPTSGTHSGALATRLLELEQRADLAPDVDERIALWVQLGASYDAEPLPDSLRRELSVRLFRRTAVEWPGGAPKWLERLLDAPLEKAELGEALSGALCQEGLEPEIARELALRAGAALEERAADPVGLYRALAERASAFREAAARAAVLAELARLELAAGNVGAWSTHLAELKALEAPELLLLLERSGDFLTTDESAWSLVESTAIAAEEPLAAVRAYERALKREEQAEAVTGLAERLTRFVDQELGDPRALTTSLLRVLEVSPEARWAFDRVKLALSIEGRFETLFPLYDRRIEAERDDELRAALLDEAAIAARDVAGDAERALAYWERYFAEKPRDARVDVALERLYERHKKPERLIEHLSRRAEALSGPELARVRERIAGLWLDLCNGAAALSVIEALLRTGESGETTLALLERVFAFEVPDDSPPEAVQEQRLVARHAASLLRREYARLGRLADAARVLADELSTVAERRERIQLLTELNELREALGDAAGCFECRGDLLELEPASAEHRSRLADLAVELDRMGDLAEIEVRAAGRAADEDTRFELLTDAARIELGLGRTERALELYERCLEDCKKLAHRLDAARALERLFAESDRPLERCAVLERIAELEASAQVRREVLVEAARVALEELDDARRAARAYTLVLETHPTDRTLLDGWIRALGRADDPETLARALTRRAELDPEHPSARDDLVAAARLRAERLDEPEKAIEVCRRIRERYGRDPETFEMLARLFESRGRFHELATLIAEEAESGQARLSLFTRLAEIHAEHTHDLGAALSAYVRAGALESAAELLCKNPSLFSDDPSFALGLVGDLERRGRSELAEQVLRGQLRHFGGRRPKESAAVHLRLGEVLRNAGRSDEALAELKAAVERHPGHPALLEALGELAHAAGDAERAEQSYRALLMLVHHSTEAKSIVGRAELYLRLSAICAERGEPERAEDHVAWAFEAALGSEDEARALEHGLARRGRVELLKQAIRARLDRASDPAQALEAAADWLAANAGGEAPPSDFVEQARGLAERVARELDFAAPDARETFARVLGVYDALGQAESAVSMLASALERATPSETLRSELELRLCLRLLELPERRSAGIERLWSLLERGVAVVAAATVLADLPESSERIEELVLTLGNRRIAAAEAGDAEHDRELAWCMAAVLERTGHLDRALDEYRALADDGALRVKARRAALRLLARQDSSELEIADAIEALLEVESPDRAAGLALRLVSLGEALGDAARVERGLTRTFFAAPEREDVRERLLELLEEREDYPAAVAVLERALEHACAPELVLRLADAYLRSGSPDRALELLDTLGMRVAPERAVRRRRAATLEAAGRVEAALEELLQLDEAYGDAHEEILSALERTRLWEDSERWALVAIDRFLAADRVDDAREVAEHRIERSPEHVPTLKRLAELQVRKRAYGAAIATYRRVVRLEPDGPGRIAATLALARAAEKAGTPLEVLADLEAAFLQAPETPELRRELKKLYEASGQRERHARLLLTEAERADAAERPALVHRAAELLAEEGKITDALAALEGLTANGTEHLDALLLSSRLLRTTGRKQEALAVVRGILNRESRPRGRLLARVYRELAELHLGDDDLVEAHQALTTAHQLDRTDPDTAFQLGLLAADLDEVEAALLALRTFVALRDHGSDRNARTRTGTAYFRLACLEHDRGQITMARRMALQALAVDPQNSDAERLLGNLGT